MLRSFSSEGATEPNWTCLVEFEEQGGIQRVAGIGEAQGGVGTPPWARVKPLKDDPAMQLLGQEPLRRGKSIGGWQDSCDVHDLRASDGESAP